MTEVSKIVEDFIHESYLMSLSERDLLKHLEEFSDTCGKAIAGTIRDSLELVRLNNKLSIIRANQLAESAQLEERQTNENLSGADIVVLKVRQIIKNKCLILDAIEEVAPGAAEMIKKETDPELRRNRLRKETRLLKSVEAVAHVSKESPEPDDDNGIKKTDLPSEKKANKFPLLVLSTTLFFTVFFFGTLILMKGF